jgi:tetratricopeptide (TPR) repeat protein
MRSIGRPSRATPPAPNPTLRAAKEKQRARDFAGAAAGYREVLAREPRSVEALVGLGRILEHEGRAPEALDHFERAIAVAPSEPAIRRDAARVLVDLGRWGDAATMLERLVAGDPRDPSDLALLGRAWLEAGCREEAIAALRRATAAHPFYSPGYFELARALYDDRDLAPALEAMGLAVLHDGESDVARFAFGAMLAQSGAERAAREQFDRLLARSARYEGAIASWRFALERRTARTRFVRTTRDGLQLGVDAARADGLVIELGVRYGGSIRWIAERAAEVHGFDTFEGLPEAWHELGKGAYSTHGVLPPVPANVTLHAGLFSDSLPRFLAEHPGPLRFANLDCDLYGSAKSALDACAERIGPGTVLAFDEYIVSATWAEDEHKAWTEHAEARGLAFEYVGFGLFSKQAIVEVR